MQKLGEAIQQKKPFRSAEVEAFLNIVRTADALGRQVERLLKPHSLTATQYNVLRILRGAGRDGATCSQIAERLVTNDPDVTRLLDRLEKSGLIERARSENDRRVVVTQLSRSGAVLLAKLDPLVDALHARQFAGMNRKALAAMVAQLEQIRAAAEEDAE
ncbi:MAG TPA: MarR family transcriptional regulator [Thermoanaerobaculia bacterium]|jgi:DNA-binding MarR family transcriptional regulator